jgi:hypothetical protein
MIVACQTPFKLPPRLARQRRVIEAKRMDSFRVFHEAIKKQANDELELIKDLIKKNEMTVEVMDDDE